MKFSAVSIVVVAAALPVYASIKEVWWNITYVEHANPDGLFPRRLIGVNGTWPPPPLDVQTTDLLKVHVTNSLDEPTSLHHHGISFNSMPWMAGATGISECGIPPGGQFEYVVPINSSGQSGTYWVHAHTNGHYIDGLRAPLIIHPPKETFSYDDEFTVVISDWFHEEHSVLVKDFISPLNPNGIEPAADSALIYFAHGASYLGSKSPSTPSVVGFNENATLPFEPGKTYRLRLINTSAMEMFYFWIDGHNMTIIEVDGVDVEAVPVDTVNLAVAQRYSVLVTARNESSLNWAIHMNSDPGLFDYEPDTLKLNITSSITYNTSAAIQDDGPIPEYIPIDDFSTLIPKEPIAAPEATRTIVLEGKLDVMDDGTNRGMFNQVTYNYPLVPGLFSAMTLGDNATNEYSYGPSAYVLEHNEVVDIVIKNGDDGDHPFHLHGHAPMFIDRVDPNNLNPTPPVNLSNPLRRDTFLIPAEGSITLRIVANNPGVWFLHCHMEWHLVTGLAVQIVEAPLQVQALSHNVPSEMLGHCKELNIPFSGNAAGHSSANDLSGLPLGPFPRTQKRFGNWSVMRYLEPQSVKSITGLAFLVSLLIVALVMVFSKRQRSSTFLQDIEKL